MLLRRTRANGKSCGYYLDGYSESERHHTFRLTPAGDLLVLHSFTGGSDGGCSFGSLILDRSGNLYGAAGCGGAFAGAGAIFKLSPAGRDTVLYNFTGDNDGSGPVGPLVRDASGNLYGVTAILI